MRAVAIIATYNEERFIGGCIEHLNAEGVEVFILENGSTDGTRDICASFLGAGVCGIEDVARDGVYSWLPLLERKAALASELEADWFLHVDADEIRLAPPGWGTLADAFARVEDDGCNAVNFLEFTFVPTVEEPDHDHACFRRTMRHYYPFLPRFPDRLNAWKRQSGPVDLCASGGHRVAFEGLRMHATSFAMRHYLFLSREHALEKYIRRTYDPAEVAAGWHRARAALRADDIVLPSANDLRTVGPDGELDPSTPRTSHFLFDASRLPSPETP